MSQSKTHKSQSLTAAVPSLRKIHRKYFQVLPMWHLLRYQTLHYNTPTPATLALSGTVQRYTVTMVPAIILPVDPGSLTL